MDLWGEGHSGKTSYLGEKEAKEQGDSENIAAETAGYFLGKEG